MRDPLASLGLRVRRARKVRGIRVVERPGADYEAPPHVPIDEGCWCDPDMHLDEDGVLNVIHRTFEN